jgi:hypothetical protein
MVLAPGTGHKLSAATTVGATPRRTHAAVTARFTRRHSTSGMSKVSPAVPASVASINRRSHAVEGSQSSARHDQPPAGSCHGAGGVMARRTSVRVNIRPAAGLAERSARMPAPPRPAAGPAGKATSPSPSASNPAMRAVRVGWACAPTAATTAATSLRCKNHRGAHHTDSITANGERSMGGRPADCGGGGGGAGVRIPRRAAETDSVTSLAVLRSDPRRNNDACRDFSELPSERTCAVPSVQRHHKAKLAK